MPMRRLTWLLALALATACTDGGSADKDGADGSDGVDTDDTEPGDTGLPGDTDEPGLSDEVTVEVCDDAPARPASGLCEVTPGSGDALLVQGIILGIDTTWEGGSVLIEGDEITCVGCDCASEPAAADATVLACADGVVSPGLVNPHEHITFSENAPDLPEGTRYNHRHDWRGSIPTPGNVHNSDGTRWAELRHLVSGTTTMVGSGGSDGLVRNADQTGDRTEGADLPYVDNETFPLDDGNETQREDCDWDYKRTVREIWAEDAYVPHIAEGINDRAHEEFRCQSTNFDGGQDAVLPNAAHIHSIGLDAQDYLDMVQDGTTLIWSPRSNIALYGQTANVTLFDTLGGTLALGTDWSYSGSISMVRELACADLLDETYYGDWFTDVELWRMATVHAAHSIAADGLLGELTPGAYADLAIYDGRDHPGHRAVIEAGATDVAMVIRGGEPLFGEAAAMTDLGTGCEAVDVCGESRGLCLQEEIGATYAELADTVQLGIDDRTYPVFFCDEAPVDEPTCVPSRPGEYDGTPTADDSDADGLPDADDLCPTVFSPLRPMDDGTQPDADGDGVGDACDPTPVPDDIDEDGTDNARDNCPFTPNADQADADADDVGDACDACVDTPSPFGVCPAIASGTIQDIHDDINAWKASFGGDPDSGVHDIVGGIVVEGVVTGVGSSGYLLQDPDDADGLESGLYVFTGGSPGVDVGDAVIVDGDVSVYFGESQIEEVSTTYLGAGTLPAPLEVTVAEAATEPYEGVLVRLTDVTAADVTDEAYDCSVDGSCSDEDLWEIGGPTGVVVYDRLYEDGDWVSQIGTVPVTGVMGWRWGRRRLMPRFSTDFGTP